MRQVYINGKESTKEPIGWDDIRFPFVGRNLDITSGRIDYNYSELGIDFADNCRLASTEQIGMICQMQHSWKMSTDVHPHLHWIQSSANVPNWLLEYRVYDNGDAVPGAWTRSVSTAHIPYTAGSMLQISMFPAIDMSTVTGVSGFIDFKLYRDTPNTSTLFAGADPLSGNALAKEFDIHYVIDRAQGSRTEYSK